MLLQKDVLRKKPTLHKYSQDTGNQHADSKQRTHDICEYWDECSAKLYIADVRDNEIFRETSGISFSSRRCFTILQAISDYKFALAYFCSTDCKMLRIARTLCPLAIVRPGVAFLGAQRVCVLSHVMPIAQFATRSELAARKAAGSAPFPDKARALFDKIESGCKDVLEANPGFSIARSGNDSMRLSLPDGRAFDLVANADSQQVCFVTAKTGLQFTYEMKQNAAGDWTWVHTTDGHLLFEHLAREMVYHLKGYPSF